MLGAKKVSRSCSRHRQSRHHGKRNVLGDNLSFSALLTKIIEFKSAIPRITLNRLPLVQDHKDKENGVTTLCSKSPLQILKKRDPSAEGSRLEEFKKRHLYKNTLQLGLSDFLFQTHAFSTVTSPQVGKRVNRRIVRYPRLFSKYCPEEVSAVSLPSQWLVSYQRFKIPAPYS